MIKFSKRIFGTFKCFDLIMIFPVYECLLFNWVCRLRSKSHGRDVGFSNGNKFFQYWISGTFILCAVILFGFYNFFSLGSWKYNLGCCFMQLLKKQGWKEGTGLGVSEQVFFLTLSFSIWMMEFSLK